MDVPRKASLGWSMLISVGSIALTTVLLIQLQEGLQPATVALLYLLIVIVMATTRGLGPAITAAVLAFLAINFFFVPPLHTFAVANPQDLIRLVVFLVVAISTSSLAARARIQALTAAHRAFEQAALYNLSQALSAAVTLDHMLPLFAEAAIQLVSVPACTILLYDPAGQLIEYASAGAGTAPARQTDIALRSGTHSLGMLRIYQTPEAEPLSGPTEELLQTIVAQLVLVVERAQL